MIEHTGLCDIVLYKQVNGESDAPKGCTLVVPGSTELQALRDIINSL